MTTPSFSLLGRIKTVRDAQLPDTPGVSSARLKCLLYTLVTYADAEGIAYPTVTTLADRCGCARSNVHALIAALLKLQLLHHAPAPERISWNAYEVDFARLRALVPSAPRSRRGRDAPCERAQTAATRATNRPTKTPENPPDNRAPIAPADTPTDTPAQDAGEDARARAVAVGALMSSWGLTDHDIAKAGDLTLATIDDAPAVALIALGVDARVATNLLKEFGDNRCINAVTTVVARRASGRGMQSPAGFAVAAVRQGWEPIETEASEKAKKERRNAIALERVRAMDIVDINARWHRFAMYRSKGNPMGHELIMKTDPRKCGITARHYCEALDAGVV